MKILFISKSDLPDFQNDMVFHGGRELLGDDFVDLYKVWYCYAKEKDKYWNVRVPNNGKSYGNGFTLYGLFDLDNIDRTDITTKIKTHYFNKIIYGSIRRCSNLLSLVVKYYKKEEIIFIDGEDDQYCMPEMMGAGIYYKRECNISTARSINFGIPELHIVTKIPTKEKDYANIIPGDKSTYIYNNQTDYYYEYRRSYFGVTFKKGGWDCLRHYEILMNGCIPWFPDLMYCPTNTLTRFPKHIILNIMDYVKNNNNISEIYYEWVYNLLKYTRENLTTKEIIKGIL